MKRHTMHKILNVFLVLFFINQALTVIFMDHLPIKVFQIFHKGGGAVLLCLIALHIILNFNWIKANYLSK